MGQKSELELIIFIYCNWFGTRWQWFGNVVHVNCLEYLAAMAGVAHVCVCVCACVRVRMFVRVRVGSLIYFSECLCVKVSN